MPPLRALNLVYQYSYSHYQITVIASFCAVIYGYTSIHMNSHEVLSNIRKGYGVKNKSLIGFIIGILVAVGICFAPLEGLSVEAQRCLGLSLLAVIWWATGVTHPGYTSVFLLGSYVLFKVAPGSVVFSLWTTPIIYLVVGGYLIASAVSGSGLGKRIAYLYITKYVSSYSSIIVGAYVLGFLLSFLIPHPWPRSFLIMSVMLMIIKGAKIPAADAANIGLAVFASSCPTSAILLTGDSVINSIAVSM